MDAHRLHPPEGGGSKLQASIDSDFVHAYRIDWKGSGCCKFERRFAQSPCRGRHRSNARGGPNSAFGRLLTAFCQESHYLSRILILWRTWESLARFGPESACLRETVGHARPNLRPNLARVHCSPDLRACRAIARRRSDYKPGTGTDRPTASLDQLRRAWVGSGGGSGRVT